MDTTYNYHEKKIVAILSSKVTPEIALNVIGHLSISVGATVDQSIMGRSVLIDKSNIKHSGISKYPFICTKVKSGRLKRAIAEARNHPDVMVFDYPLQMLQTGHDDELAQALAESEEKEIEYLGAILYGNSADIDSITGKFTLWRAD